MIYDCVIVGGGPAGLSAALMLGRCRRRVLVCDAGQPRNRRARAAHAFLTRDGIAPEELLRIAREQLAPYDTIEQRAAEVVDAARGAEGFEVRCADRTRLRCRKLLLATGVVDELPPIAGLEALYGVSVHHCPYCDGWEWRDQPIAIYGRGEEGAGLAQGLTVWSRDLLLCTDGPAELPGRLVGRLESLGIPVREDRVLGLEGRDGKLERIVFERGPPAPRRALFFATGQHQASPLAARLGCAFTGHGAVATGKCEATNVPGLYVCGDASREAQFVVVAAAEGAEAGMAINKALLEEELADQKSSSIPSRASLGTP
ncbi:MAG TPA: NAD(P)/FAD-dependent oxidoreductase [Gemmatimonadales bacterium]|nr:NAD(P)/FAD-dependent oxidoreductase [Gemmatimonadales bacterium]